MSGVNELSYDGYDWSQVPGLEELWLVQRNVQIGGPKPRKCLLVSVHLESLTEDRWTRRYVIPGEIGWSTSLQTYLLGHDLFGNREDALREVRRRARADVSAMSQIVDSINQELGDIDTERQHP